MARRPDYPSTQLGSKHSGKHIGRDNSDHDQVLRPEELKQLRHNLSHLSVDAVRHAYHTAYARCRMVNDRVPSARSVQELVQIWKQLWKWR